MKTYRLTRNFKENFFFEINGINTEASFEGGTRIPNTRRGYFKTNNPEMIEALENSPLFNDRYILETSVKSDAPIQEIEEYELTEEDKEKQAKEDAKNAPAPVVEETEEEEVIEDTTETVEETEEVDTVQTTEEEAEAIVVPEVTSWPLAASYMKTNYPEEFKGQVTKQVVIAGAKAKNIEFPNWNS